ncbi:MAG TPA: restriction endonuclease subunit S, partial [Bacteroidia bacterium]|nr:restriction endonuclease subunit S [Bacteroidia bacterium]
MDFVEYTIGDISISLKTGKTPKTSNPEYFDGNILWACPSDFIGKKHITDTGRTITEVALEMHEASLYKPGTILISTIGEIGKVAIADKPISANQQITGIRVKDTIILPELFYYWII